jgi:hypothetical protein
LQLVPDQTPKKKRRGCSGKKPGDHAQEVILQAPRLASARGASGSLPALNGLSLCAGGGPTEHNILTEGRLSEIERSTHLPLYGRTFARRYRRTVPCRTRKKLRSERVGRRPYQWERPPGYRCRWRAAHPRDRVGRLLMCRRATPRCLTQWTPARKKSPTSAWPHSMSSTQETPQRFNSGEKLP